MNLYIQFILPVITLYFGYHEPKSEPVVPTTSTDIKLYEVSFVYDTKNAFLNMSEAFFENKNWDNEDDTNDHIILTESNLSQDITRLNANQRSHFFKLIGVSESDKIFIYNIGSDVIQTFKVQDIPVLARLNIYTYNQPYHEYDYEFGFDLGKKYTGGANFTFVGKENPFQTGQLKPILWEQISNADFPKKFSPDIILDRRKKWLEGFHGETSFKFSYDHLDYYIQNLQNGERHTHRYMLVINSKTKEIIYEQVHIDSESTHLNPLNTTTNQDQYQSQWTGQLFKNKPMVMFGFIGHGFGCPSITVLGSTESAISILCDNRH